MGIQPAKMLDRAPEGKELSRVYRYRVVPQKLKPRNVKRLSPNPAYNVTLRTLATPPAIQIPETTRYVEELMASFTMFKLFWTIMSTTFGSPGYPKPNLHKDLRHINFCKIGSEIKGKNQASQIKGWILNPSARNP